MKIKTGIIVTVLLAFLAGCTTTQTTKPASEPSAADDKKGWYSQLVDASFVAQYAKIPRPKDVMIIDARPKARKYDKGHIPGAYSIPFPPSKVDKVVDTLPDNKSTMLIYYCGGIKCMKSHKSAFKAEKLGYTNVKVYADGMPDWKKKGNVVAVSVTHLKKQIDAQKKMAVIDSRPKKRKYDKGHIPTAISIPDSSFDKMANKLPADKTTPLYFYCGGYKCKLSPNSANKALKLGYKKVYIVPEGYPGWKKAFGTKAAPALAGGKEAGTITISSFQKVMNEAPESILVVDVRDPEEYADGTIKGAINLPINKLEEKMDTLPSGKSIVFVCGTAGRAGEAYDMVQMFKPELKTHFLNAEVTFNKDGSYSLKELE